MIIVTWSDDNTPSKTGFLGVQQLSNETNTFVFSEKNYNFATNGTCTGLTDIRTHKSMDCLEALSAIVSD